MDSKVVIITGADRGIGKALSIALSRQGFRVVATGRDEQALEQLTERLEGEYMVQKCDVTDPQECRAAVDSAVAKFGQLDVLINNAGVYVATSLMDTPEEKIKQVIDVAFNGTVYLSKQALEVMAPQKSGQIVSIQDVTYKKGAGPINPEHPRTIDLIGKFAKAAFTELLRREAVQYGVIITAVYLQSVASNLDIDEPMEEHGKASHPKEVVEAVLDALKTGKTEVSVLVSGSS